MHSISNTVYSACGDLTISLLQKDGDPSKKDTVVLLLQDMLEVVTRDMMVNEIRLVYFISVIWTGRSLLVRFINI